MYIYAPAIPPISIPIVTQANSIWKKLYKISGIRGEPGEGSPSTFINPKLRRLPMKPFVAEEENARE